MGSSPRVWGQEADFPDMYDEHRIIPTRVGTSRPTVTGREKERDHPHACGDKLTIVPPGFTLEGSSPRVWGQVFNCVLVFERHRIIPTRVGTSCPIISFSTVPKDHPHACGDKLQILLLMTTLKGSSPRVWGQAAEFGAMCGDFRIIPTRVGTRKLDLSNFKRSKDHPHACGDKLSMRHSDKHMGGSSPRVWGQALSSFRRLRASRIIPTRVGTR